jgi:hypothetical protein
MGEAPHPQTAQNRRARVEFADRVLERAEFFALPEKRLKFAELRQGLARLDQLGRKL